jgi:hypothetical protein
MISRWAEEKWDNNQGKTMPWKAGDFTGGVLPRQTKPGAAARIRACGGLPAQPESAKVSA